MASCFELREMGARLLIRRRERSGGVKPVGRIYLHIESEYEVGLTRSLKSHKIMKEDKEHQSYIN